MKYFFAFFCFFSVSASFSVEDTPVTHDEIAGASNPFGTREWKGPDFDGQGPYIGYNKDAFKVPKGLESRVEFWKKIYTQYTTDQGIIHNAENIDEVYKKVDFGDLIASNMTKHQIEKEKQKRVDSLKKIILMEKPNLSMSDLRFQLGKKNCSFNSIFLS